MTELQVLPAPAPAPTSEPVSAPPTLITEREVALGTAAALGVQPKRIRWWNRATLFAAPSTPRQKPREVPRRYGFLEDALMAREMDRL